MATLNMRTEVFWTCRIWNLCQMFEVMIRDQRMVTTDDGHTDSDMSVPGG